MSANESRVDVLANKAIRDAVQAHADYDVEHWKRKRTPEDARQHYEACMRAAFEAAGVVELVEAAQSALQREEFKQGPDAGNDGLVRRLRAALSRFAGGA